MERLQTNCRGYLQPDITFYNIIECSLELGNRKHFNSSGKNIDLIGISGTVFLTIRPVFNLFTIKLIVMKMIVKKEHKNAKKKSWEDGDSLKRFDSVIVNDKTPKLDIQVAGEIGKVSSKKGVKGDTGNKQIRFGRAWVTHKLSTPLDKIDQEIYEWFCCGYLWYYDEVTRNGAIDHAIYFDWDSPKKVSIYLYPSPSRSRDKSLTAGGGGVDPQPPPTPPPPPEST
jgi:hypothetical protein